MYKIQPKTDFTGKNTIYLTSCHSTNETAFEIIQKEGLKDGSIVITDNQTRGKGQRGNNWISGIGQNITCSLVYKPHFLDLQKQFSLNMAIALGIKNGLEPFLQQDIAIKWPNDIFVNGYKLGGILIESILLGKKIDYTVIGMGINVNQRHFDLPRATSIAALSSSSTDLDITLVVESMMEAIEQKYLELRNYGSKNILQSYEQCLFQKNQWRKYQNENGIFDGKIIGVDTHGYLQMETKVGLKQFDTKEFEYIY